MDEAGDGEFLPERDGRRRGGVPRRVFYYSANKQYQNLGDVVINRQLLNLAREYGQIRAMVSDQPSSFMDSIGLAPEECLPRRQFMLEFARVVFGRIPGAMGNADRQQVYMLLTPGGTNGPLALSPRRDFANCARSMLCRIAGLRAGHFGFSLPSQITTGRRWYESFFKPRNLRAANGPRDSRSLRILKSWGISNSELVPDLAFLQSWPAAPRPALLPGHYVAMSFRDTRASRREDLVRTIGACVDWVGDGVRNLYCGWQVEYDRTFMRRLFSRYEQEVSLVWQPEEWSFEDRLPPVYQHAELVLSNRLHVLLFTWLQGGIPVAVTATDVSPKVTQIFRDEGLERLIMDMDTGLTPDAIDERLDGIARDADAIRHRLTGVIEDRRDTIRRAWRRFVQP